jgi:hypothetical protein
MSLSNRKSCCAVACVRSRLSKRNVFLSRWIVYGELSAPMRYNVLQICLVRLTKLHLSKPTNVYLKIPNKISGSKKNFRVSDHNLARRDDPRPPHKANVLLVAVVSNKVWSFVQASNEIYTVSCELQSVLNSYSMMSGQPVLFIFMSAMSRSFRSDLILSGSTVSSTERSIARLWVFR